MTILQSLANRYARLSLTGEAPAAGFAPAPISFAIILDQEGHYVTTQDERVSDGRKLRTKTQLVPALPKRTIGIASGAFWDKTSYVLGRTALDGQLSAANQAKSAKRLNKEHAAFLARHERLLDGTSDIGCTALLTFLRQWSPEHYETLKDAEAMLDQNVAFRLAGAAGFMHDRIAARAALLAETVVPDVLPEAMCLVTGEVAPIARLHPLIKGVAGAQPWGAALVSFNLDSCTSYGKIQGANAPVSQAAAFAYGTVLNGLLTTSSINAKGRPIYPNRVSLGETTVAFWAEHEDTENIARSVISHEGDGLSLNDVLPIDEETETVKLSDVLHKMQDGDPLRDAAPEMDPASRVYVLGLSPNVARLSVRFWVEQSLGDFARHFQQHWADLRLDPLPHPWPPSLWRLLLELVPHRNPENIPPRLTGDVMRSILSGHPYPRTLLIQTIMRIRIDRDEEDPRTGRLLERVQQFACRLAQSLSDPDAPLEAHRGGSACVARSDHHQQRLSSRSAFLGAGALAARGTGPA